MNQAEVDCLAANTYTQLALTGQGQQWRRFAEQAERHTLHARQARSDRYERSRVVDEVRLARVRLAQREPVEAVRVATQAMSMTGQIRSAIVCDWLVRFDRELTTRHRALAQAREFSDGLRDHLRHQPPPGSAGVSGAGTGRI